MGKLIGLLGRKRVGKDTVADYLINNYNFTKHAFAHPIKEILKIMFDFTESQLNNDKEKIDDRWGISPRIAMQQFGTDFVRDNICKYIPNIKNNLNDETLWIKLFRIWYEKNKEKDIIISDVRFLDEIEVIKSLGGKIIKINRDTNQIDNHKSECNIENYDKKLIDYQIDNNSTLNNLYSQTNTIINNIKI